MCECGIHKIFQKEVGAGNIENLPPVPFLMAIDKCP